MYGRGAFCTSPSAGSLYAGLGDDSVVGKNKKLNKIEMSANGRPGNKLKHFRMPTAYSSNSIVDSEKRNFHNNKLNTLIHILVAYSRNESIRNVCGVARGEGKCEKSNKEFLWNTGVGTLDFVEQ